MQVQESTRAGNSGAGVKAGEAGVGPAQVERLAAFVQRVSYGDISEEARKALKVRVLDSIACAIGALDGPPIHRLRA
jgi:2-methylcitrate dehydratase PrpD